MIIDTRFETWLKDSQLLSLDTATAVIAVPTARQAEMLRTRFTRLIEDALEQDLGYRVTCLFTVQGERITANGHQ